MKAKSIREQKRLGITGLYCSGLDWQGSGLGLYIQSVECLDSNARDLM